MIVYNITIKIHPAIEADWLQWQREEHIPEIMASNQFTGWKMYRLLEQEEQDGITYIVQYTAPSLDNYRHYLEAYAPRLRDKAIQKWGDAFIAFRTVMQIVN